MSSTNNKVIMEDGLFYATDCYGNVDQKHDAGLGLYMNDTRFLSHYELRINGQSPELLESSTKNSYLLSTLLKHEQKDVGAIQIKRSTFLLEGKLHEQLQITNFFLTDQRINLTLQFFADFQDMFIVRRYRSGDVGELLDPAYTEHSLQLKYRGKDNQIRLTEIHWSGEPRINQQEQLLEYELHLNRGQTASIELIIVPQQKSDNELKTAKAEAMQADPKRFPSFEEALHTIQESYSAWRRSNTKVSSSNSLFNDLFARSMQDLRMLQRDIGYGKTTVAGLPWFATVFGRDSLITSLFMLPLQPSHALGTLRTLSAYQGKTNEPWRDEEVGKIMHEIRFGELVTTGQSPFSPYYGGVDSTPLFLVLLVEYVKWTGDMSIVIELEEHIKAALAWIDRRCSNNECGFLTYKQEAEQGFPNQGWKDSANSIVHHDGSLAKAPIALIEVQGYICYAKQGLSQIWQRLGKQQQAEQLALQAKKLMENIITYFWLEEEQYFSIALDGALKPVRSITSNPGHLLLTGLLPKEYALNVGKRLLDQDMFNGYGIRTMSKQSAGYYPMSYHNGSVWPHDNGMILLGCLRSGLHREAGVIVKGLLAVAAELSDQRYPELFCGYGSEECEGLVPYPTTCSPQAWSGATTFAMLQAMLGLQVDILQEAITITPNLPNGIDELNVSGLSIGSGELDIQLIKNGQTAQANATIIRNTTGLSIVVQSL